MHVLPAKMRESGPRSFSKGRGPTRPFRNRQLKSALFHSPLQSSAILSLMRIGSGEVWGLRGEVRNTTEGQCRRETDGNDTGLLTNAHGLNLSARLVLERG